MESLATRLRGTRPRAAVPLALQIIPPLQTREEPVKLEAAMQGLVLDQRHPVALELAGTGEQRYLIVRATTGVALDHVEAQLRAFYPQLEVRALPQNEDPFRLEPGEAVSAIELVAGAPAYLPLRTWQEEEKEQEGSDPLLGLLAALSKLPDGVRAVAQIALVPAPDEWSRKDLRKSIEPALEPERRASQREASRDIAISRYGSEALSTQALISIGLLVGVFWLVHLLLPGWIWGALWKIVTGQMPHLAAWQIVQLLGYGVGLALVVTLVLIVVNRLVELFNPHPIYDMREVARKTSHVAYRTRLRLYVIGRREQPVAGSHELATGDTVPDLPRVQGRRQSARCRGLFARRSEGERAQAGVRQDMLLRLIAAYRQFHTASGGYFIPRRIPEKTAESLLARETEKYGPGWQRNLNRSKHMLSVDALAVLWHMPDAAVLPELALVEHRRARTLLIPPELARQFAGHMPIGYSEHGGYRLPFALIPQFFTLHTLIGGKSGEGKSTFIEHIAREAMEQGGLVLIDPHGDLCEHVLQAVPYSRTDDVVLIDLSDRSASVGINPLDVALGRGRDKAISDLLKTLAHIWVSAWGPRMENAFEMGLRTLFEANKSLIAHNAQQGPLQQYTLLDMLPLMTNGSFCQALLQHVQDDYLHRWWREYYEPLSLMQQREIINPVITKVAKFESEIARRIVGQSLSTLNLTQMIAERKIILFKLAKGIVGSDVAALLGATLLGLIQITLEEQGSIEEQARVRFPIILDEFQVLAGMDYGALAELRKYGVTFFLATQSLEYLQKLDPVLLPMVLANVKQLVVFHMSAQDAETLYKELGVEPEDILNLDMYTCYVKLAAMQRRQPTFSVRVQPPPAGNSIQAEYIRTRCRMRYARPVDVIDGMLREAMLRSIRLAPTFDFESEREISSQPGVSIESASGDPPKQARPAALIEAPAGKREGDAAKVERDAEEASVQEQKTRKRGKRGRRSGKRGDKNEQEGQERGEIMPFAFDEDLADELGVVESFIVRGTGEEGEHGR